MKKIVMFTNTFAPLVGGLERSVATAQEDLTALGQFCRVVTPACKGAEESADGVLRLPALTGLGEKEFSIALPVARLDHWMEAIQPDLLHTHQPFLLGETAWRIARRRRIPVVFTHHTLYERYAHYLFVDNERTRRLMINVTTHYANRCDLVIAPTESVREILLERGVTAPVEVVPTGIELNVFGEASRELGRSALGFEASHEVIGHLGRISQEKNIECIVDAAIRVLRDRPNARFLLVGDGDRLEWARAECRSAGVADRVTTPGMLRGAAVADAYAAMDVFLFASLSDTQGLVLAEALAAGVPVIALDAPGARDCVTHGSSGWLLPADITPPEFARRVGELLEDSDRRNAMGRQARREGERFGRALCARRLLHTYERALSLYQPAPDATEDVWDQFAEKVEIDWAPMWDKLRTAVRSLAAVDAPAA